MKIYQFLEMELEFGTTQQKGKLSLPVTQYE